MKPTHLIPTGVLRFPNCIVALPEVGKFLEKISILIPYLDPKRYYLKTPNFS
jgi:hypothetical protein